MLLILVDYPDIVIANDVDGKEFKVTICREYHEENDTVNDTINDTIKLDACLFELTERQRNIYNIIKGDLTNVSVDGTVNDTVNAQTISEAFGISLSTAKRDLYVLRDKKLIRYIGSDKTGHWEIIM